MYIKNIKNKLIIIFTFVVSVIFLAVMWNTKWKPMAEMTELGYLKLEPIALIDGQTSAECYVVVQVDTTDGKKELNILISEAYDEISRSANLENYQSKKKVEGYYYYLESAGKVLFSKDITTAKEYMETTAGPIVEMILLLNIFLIIVIALSMGLGDVSSANLPNSVDMRKPILVCEYSKIICSVVALFCIGTGGMMLKSVYSIWTNARSPEDYFFAIGSLVLGSAFICMGIVFVFCMKNYAIVFFEDGIMYRNIIGKTRKYTDEQIEYVSIFRSRGNYSIRIRTVDMSIWLTSYCTNYYKAVELVGKYPCK